MLTFSCSRYRIQAATLQLIGNAAHFVEIKTFHSYCFDLLGRVGYLDEAGDVVKQAAEMIDNGKWNPIASARVVLSYRGAET